MTQEAVESLLKEEIGLNPESIGAQNVARAIQERMIECGVSDTDAYLAELRTSKREVEELVELVVVPETWFFRDEEPFAFLARYVTSEWLPLQKPDVLRILSVPCSTGEEPYSIAMSLMDAHLIPEQFHIDAMDISKKALADAERAVYGPGSFRGENLAFRDRYFEEAEGGYRLIPSVKNSVYFSRANLLDPGFLAGKAPYDVIFCRNLMIYFDAPARERTNIVLDRFLTKEGIIFVGHSETFSILSSRFVSVRHPRTFAYRRAGDARLSHEAHHDAVSDLPQEKKSRIRHALPVKRADKKALTFSDAAPSPTCPPSNEQELSPDKVDSLLDAASSLANQGRLDEARARCERFISENGANAQAYCLLGLIQQASGEDERAEECFNKAVYLKPDYYEALISLALLAEHRGDEGRAAVLRRRAERIQSESG
jgi:chemotaxis protein methyltransferase WspC